MQKRAQYLIAFLSTKYGVRSQKMTPTKIKTHENYCLFLKRKFNPQNLVCIWYLLILCSAIDSQRVNWETIAILLARFCLMHALIRINIASHVRILCLDILLYIVSYIYNEKF